MTKNLRMISALLLLAFAATANANWDGSIASTAPATRDIYSVVEGSSSSMSSSSWDEGIWWSSSSMSSSSVASYSSGYYRNYYVITTPEELAWFAAQVNAGNTAYNAVLDNDIVLYEDSITDANKAGVTRWSAIGKTKATAFKGIFDGNGHTVRGMYGDAGFFGYIASLGVVKNLKLKNIYISSADTLVGGVAGFNGGIIENCAGDGAISGSGASGNIASVGGIAGFNDGVIRGCTNRSVISVSGGPWAGTYVGGVAGFNGGIITRCANYGSVSRSGSGPVYVGGVAGGLITAASSLVYDNYSQAPSVTAAASWGTSSVGGIVGYMGIMPGSVYGYSKYTSGKAQLWRNYSATKTIAFTETIAFTSSSGYVGGVIGEKSAGNAWMDYFDSSLADVTSAVSGVSDTDSVRGRSTDEMQADEFAWRLNTSDGDSANIGVWSRGNGYPVFADSVHFAIRRIRFVSGSDTTLVYTDSTAILKSLPAMPAKTDSVFIGWVYDSTKILTTTDRMTQDVIAVPKYLKGSRFIVTFKDSVGNVLFRRFSNEDSTVIAPAFYSGALWVYDGKKVFTEKTKLTSDLTVMLAAGYTVTFNDEDSTKIVALLMNADSTMTFPPDPVSADGRAFRGWLYNGYHVFSSGMKLTADLTVYAKYSASPLALLQYPDKNGLMMTKGDSTASVASENCSYKCKAYLYDGNKVLTPKTKVKENLTLKDTLVNYVAFDDENSAEIVAYALNADSTATFPPDPVSADGRAFRGWLYDGYHVFSSGMKLTADLTVYAKYSATPLALLQYPDENGLMMTKGDSTAPVASCDNYDSYYYFPYSCPVYLYDGNKVLTSGTKVKENLTLKDTLVDYVVFDDEDSTEVVAYALNADSTVSFPSVPATRGNLPFIGWVYMSDMVTLLSPGTKLTFARPGPLTFSVRALYSGTRKAYRFNDDQGNEIKTMVTNEDGTINYPADPKKVSSVKYDYTFKFWALSGTTFTAKFDSTLRNYVVTFSGCSEKALAGGIYAYSSYVFQKADSVAYGDIPEYKGDVPAADSCGLVRSAQYEDVFSGWYPAVTAVTGDAAYRALFVQKLRIYPITFLNADKDTLQKLSVEYGVVPEYTAATPTMPADATYSYQFVSWTPTIAAVTGAATYTARYVAVEGGGSSPAAASSSSAAASSSSSEHSTFVAVSAVPHFTLAVTGRTLNVQNAAVNSRYALMDAQGRVLSRGVVQSAEFTIALPGAGAYFVRIGAATQAVRAR